MTDKKLTERQESFVAYYIGDAKYNATEAARLAGYSSPAASGHENLQNPEIKRRVNEQLEGIRSEGIGNKAVRLAELSELNDSLKFVQSTRALEAKERYNQGEDIPEGAESGLLVEQIKTTGAGPNAVTTHEWVIDKTLIDGRTKVLEQAAREVGDRDKKIELTGANGGPLEVASAKSKLLDMLEGE